MPADFLSVDDLDTATIMAILTRAQDLSTQWQARVASQSLAGLRVALINDDGGWQNTTAFELGIGALGGQCVRVPLTLLGKERIEDLAAYLDNWFDIIVVRTPDLGRLRALAAAARTPVINARTMSNHPCETLGDLAFILSQRGSLDGLRVVVIAPDANILGSWAEAANVLPIDVVQIFPQRWHASRFDRVTRFSATTALDEITGADVLITDCWPKGATPAEMLPYQVNGDLIGRIRPDSLFIPCPPVTRGEEVTDEAMRAPTCRSVEAKAYLLHAQNALLEALSPLRA